MSTEPVPPYRDRVYRYLLEQIAGHHYREGDMLNERGIAAQLSVSRTPVREAIQMLEAEGWVTVVPWKGIFVRAVTPQQVDEVFQIRTSLEVLAVELLLRVPTPRRFSHLREIVEEQRRFASRKTAQEFIRLDREFHNEIARYAGNSLLCDYLQRLDNQLLRLGLFAVRNLARFRHTVKEHEKLLDAMEAGNARAAAKAMRDHIEKTRTTLLAQLTEGKENTHETGADSNGG